MIFVTVGTTCGFDELVRAVDRIASDIKDEIIIQIGAGRYRPKNCKHFDFTPDLQGYIKDADLIISHGGAGTSFEILTMGKRLISVENPNVNDSHQWDFISKLEEEGHVLWCKDIKQIGQMIKKARTMKFKRYTPPKCTIHEEIFRFLEGKR